MAGNWYVHCADAPEYLHLAVSAMRDNLSIGSLEHMEFWNHRLVTRIDSHFRFVMSNPWDRNVDLSGLAIKSLKLDMLALFRHGNPEYARLYGIPHTVQRLTLRLAVAEEVTFTTDGLFLNYLTLEGEPAREMIRRRYERVLESLLEEVRRYPELLDISLELCRWVETPELRHYYRRFNKMGIAIRIRFLEESSAL